MKRVYLILTLFMTSFFLLFSYVKADNTIYVDITEEHINYIKTQEFIEIRNKSIEHCEENNAYYIIYYNGYRYQSYILEINDKKFTSYGSSFVISPGKGKSYAIEYGDFTFVGNSSSYYLSNINSYDVLLYLDTNIPYINYQYLYDMQFNYNNASYLITKEMNFPSLYQIYIDANSTPEIEENPKLEIVTNFYVLVIDKIKLLTNYIATDYIILSALVIFIFVAVIGLVRRLK